MSDIQKIVLITGAARRIGAEIARTFHQAGYGVMLHCRHSIADAEVLAKILNENRPKSAWAIQADLQSVEQIQAMIVEVVTKAGGLDVLVNNASTFYETPIGSVTEENWNDLMGSNLKAPFFVSQAAAPELKKQQGSIVNIVDIYAKRPLANYSVYSTAKAGLAALTKSLAKELAPHVRVNGVAPGVILWPEEPPQGADAIVEKIPLKRQGNPMDIAEMVLFLSEKAKYVTGQVIDVDGGKSLV
jgi:pteridine reductase